MEDRNLFKAFKRIAHNLVDLKVAQNIQAGRGPTLTDKDKREIIRQAWEEAFSIENMRSSWAQTGFRLDPIHGYVCDQRVLWELLAEEERVVQAKRAAGIEVADDLNYDVFNIRKGAGGAANDESDSDSEEDEDTSVSPTRTRVMVTMHVTVHVTAHVTALRAAMEQRSSAARKPLHKSSPQVRAL